MDNDRPDGWPSDEIKEAQEHAKAEKADVKFSETERLQKESDEKYSALMDQMEASIDEKGQYFTKIGDKDVDTAVGLEDQRALILLSEDKDEDGNTHYTAITQKGIYDLKTEKEDEEEHRRHIDSRPNSAQYVAAILNNLRLSPDSDYRKSAIFHYGKGDSMIRLSQGLYFTRDTIQPSSKSDDELAEVMRKSMELADNPRKRAVEEAQQKIQTADAISSLLSNPTSTSTK